MATCVDVAEAKYPATRKVSPSRPSKAEASSPSSAEARSKREAIYWEHEGNRAIRQGPWKLVSRYPDRWELYNMLDDRTETKDLAPQQPQRAARMAAAYENWAARANVQPWDKVRAAPRSPAPIPPE